jgi:hypothetical protein
LYLGLQMDRTRHDSEVALMSTKTNLDDQITALYTKVSSLMTENSSIGSMVKRSVHLLSEAHVWSLSDIVQCCENDLVPDPSTKNREQSSGYELASSLEQRVAHICSDLSSLRRGYEDLQKEVVSFGNKLQTSTSDLEGVFVDIPKGICDDLSSSRNMLERDTTMSALCDVVGRVVLLSKWAEQQINDRDEVIRRVVADMSSRLHDMASAHEETTDDLRVIR